MRLVDAASRSKVENEKKEDAISLDVISFFSRLIDLFFLHCPDCGGKIESVGQHNGSTVFTNARYAIKNGYKNNTYR